MMPNDCAKMQSMNWDDLRFVLAVSGTGSLLGAAKQLGVDHTTVGRRVAAAERDLDVQLFTRAATGYSLTADGERLVAGMRGVEQAVLSVQRDAMAQQQSLAGTVRVTSPETLGVHYLASRLARFQQQHRGLVIELVPAGEVLDLGRQQAEIAIRPFRSESEGLVLRKLARVRYGVFASVEYLSRRPVRAQGDLSDHPILSIPVTSNETEQRWLEQLAPGLMPTFMSPVSSALLQAARAGAGLAILPCYLGDADAELCRIPLPRSPVDTLWMTVHRDLRMAPRVRAVLDFLAEQAKSDALLFDGRLAD